MSRIFGAGYDIAYGPAGHEGVQEFILAGARQPEANFITRRALAFGDHPGARWKSPSKPGVFLLCLFHMP